jgi:hypothetical protein
MIRTVLLSASVGGAASAPADTGVWVAPMRDADAVADAERRAALEPTDAWDPWPAKRVGYGPDGDLLFPPLPALDRLCRYFGAASVR